LGKDGILIADERNTPGVEKWYGKHFARMTLVATVDVMRGNRVGAKLKVFHGERFQSTIAQPYGKSRENKVLGDVGDAAQ
jgi:hypothetical protein